MKFVFRIFILIIFAAMLIGCGGEAEAPASQPSTSAPETIEISVNEETTAEAPALEIPVTSTLPEKSQEELILESMTLEEKVGQMFIARCPSGDPIDKIETYMPGGYILFAGNFKEKTPESATDMIQSFQQAAKIPMLIGVDEEGGTVCRVSLYSAFRAHKFKSPQTLYREGGLDLIMSDTHEKSEFLLKLGINVNFAPVADVSTNSDDYINARAFGKNGQETADFVRTVVETMDNSGIGSVMKHFPGYGSNADTHEEMTHDKRSLDSFKNNDFLPFSAGIGAGGDCILVSHNVVECMDADNPASLSPVVHKLLREDLGFDGVIMTDDLYMKAIREFTGVDKAAITAVKAGNDMLCCTDFEVQIPAVIAAVKSGEIEESLINEAVLRVLKWKIELGLIETQSNEEG